MNYSKCTNFYTNDGLRDTIKLKEKEIVLCYML